MKKRNLWLLGILFILLLSGMILAVVNFFVDKTPADIDTFNLFGISLPDENALNISYNISDTNLLLSTIKIYIKTNSSSSDSAFFLNGSFLFSGFHSRNYSSNSSDVFIFLLSDNQVYPATYNYNQVYMENASKTAYDLDDADTYIKIRFFNVSNTKNFSFFEVYADNQTASSTSLRIYYCNSSYVTGNPPGSNACVNFYNMLATESFNHTHSAFSKHHVIPFSINASGYIGNVYVTNTSYFLLRGRNGLNAWNIYYIPNISRIDTIQEDTNGGAGTTWINFTGTIDSHLHQYDGTETFWYYACANDSLGNQNCTPLSSDLLELGKLPPISVGIYSPTNQSYRDEISINYTDATSPNGYAIASGYNISLHNFSDDFILTIKENNSLNLSFSWNSTAAPDGLYNIHVMGCDINGLCSTGESDDFTIDNTAPLADLTCAPSTLGKGEILYCSCTGTDATSGVASTNYTLHPSTASSGIFTTICTVADVAGNSVEDSFIYTVKSDGNSPGPGGGGSTQSSKLQPLKNETAKNETGITDIPSENETGKENEPADDPGTIIETPAEINSRIIIIAVSSVVLLAISSAIILNRIKIKSKRKNFSRIKNKKHGG